MVSKLNIVEHIESNIPNIEALRTNVPITYYRLKFIFIRFIKGVLEVAHVSSL